MAEPSMAHIPPGFQVLVQKLNQRVAALEQKYGAMKGHYDDMARRLAQVEAELQRRRPGRPRKDEAA